MIRNIHTIAYHYCRYYQYGADAAELSEEECNVQEHTEVADADGNNISPALTVDLISNRALQWQTSNKQNSLRAYVYKKQCIVSNENLPRLRTTLEYIRNPCDSLDS